MAVAATVGAVFFLMVAIAILNKRIISPSPSWGGIRSDDVKLVSLLLAFAVGCGVAAYLQFKKRKEGR